MSEIHKVVISSLTCLNSHTVFVSQLVSSSEGLNILSSAGRWGVKLRQDDCRTGGLQRTAAGLHPHRYEQQRDDNEISNTQTHERTHFIVVGDAAR